MEFHTKIILHPTDFSADAMKALHVATDLLSMPKSRLVILHVIEILEHDAHLPADELEKLKVEKTNEANEKMDQYIRNCYGSNLPIPGPEKVVRVNTSVYKDIIDYMNKTDPYMTIVGQKGNTKNNKVLLGNTTHHLLEHSNYPILMVPSKIEE